MDNAEVNSTSSIGPIMIGPLAFLLNVCSPSSNQKPSSVLKEMETVFVCVLI